MAKHIGELGRSGLLAIRPSRLTEQIDRVTEIIFGFYEQTTEQNRIPNFRFVRVRSLVSGFFPGLPGVGSDPCPCRGINLVGVAVAFDAY